MNNKKLNSVGYEPTANLTINKSRIKIYDKNDSVPTYYLESGQEFQIELFNPTTDSILAKIILNGKSISQGGLVLRPGERVFLERYLDVAKKFKFDTYSVSNTEEVKTAIQNNGDFKVQFYREVVTLPYYNIYGSGGIGTINTGGSNINTYHTFTDLNSTGPITLGGTYNTTLTSIGSLTPSSLNLNNVDVKKDLRRSRRSISEKSFNKKSIETGRVEMGTNSDQEMISVDKKFDLYPFHTVEYKLLPVSQKINNTEDIMIKKYCTECGSKQKTNFKFCPNCGTKH